MESEIHILLDKERQIMEQVGQIYNLSSEWPRVDSSQEDQNLWNVIKVFPLSSVGHVVSDL